MRFIYISLIAAVIYASCAEGFLFKKKEPKDACDPNPCKHKGECMLDTKDKTKFTCFCKGDYVGPVCDGKAGCRTSFFSQNGPCGKHGNCTNDPLDQTQYHCECDKGYVGQDCDKEDECILKNPCKKDSTCTLDDKFKPVCGCQTGFTGKNCDKRDCTIIKFKGKNFQSEENIYIDKDVEQKFVNMDNLAKLCNVEIKVTKSFTKLVNPTDMVINAQAPFFIGRGIEFEVMDAKGKKVICDKSCLGKTPIGDKQAACFINGLDAILWKYSTFQPGVIHDGFHVANFKPYNNLKEYKQVGCQQDKHFPVVTGRDHLVVDYNPSGSKKCPTGLAGANCDKDDLCVKKNPCNKDSVCSLDEKLKPVCACQNGYTGTKCNKKHCTITKWSGKQFGDGWFKSKNIYISEDKKDSFEKLDALAKLCKVRFEPLRSYSVNKDPKYKIDETAPFFVGYGLEAELNDDKNKLLCNKLCLSKSPQPLKPVKCLLDGLDAIGFKHNPKYPGIIYDASLLTETVSSYTKLKEFKQVGCSDEKFLKKL